MDDNQIDIEELGAVFSEIDAPKHETVDNEAITEQETDQTPNDTVENFQIEYDDIAEDEEAADIKTESKPRWIDTCFDFLELFVFTIVTVLLLTTLVFRHSEVEGGSMDKTLAEGDHLIISNLFYTPERGDIIVCEDYSTGLRKPIVKRIIAVGGDMINIDLNGSVYINGERLQEDYVFVDGHLPFYELEYTVPEGEVFVMGDHRNASTDSRSFGSVKEEAILGKVILRFYPFDEFGKVN